MVEKKSNNEIKYRRMYYLTVQWGINYHKGFSISNYLTTQGYSSVAIYGMDKLGILLLEELNGSRITVKYGIDKNAYGIFCPITVLMPTEALEPVDAIIVTTIYYYSEIVEEMKKRITCPILSLEDIIYSYVID